MFIEDLTTFFDTEGFAVEAVLLLPSAAARSVKVIYNTPTQDVAVFDLAVEAEVPNVMIKTADLTGVRANRDSIQVNSTTYKIKRINHDGTGISTLYLS